MISLSDIFQLCEHIYLATAHVNRSIFNKASFIKQQNFEANGIPKKDTKGSIHSQNFIEMHEHHTFQCVSH